jgi:RNA polymerase sigma-70 factor (ECF subfamily)
MRGEASAQGAAVLALYSASLPEVYGYLLDRCGDHALAEDLTSETFLAAVRAEHQPDGGTVSVAWLVGVARHKLADHWRRRGRDDRVSRFTERLELEDPWDETLDRLRGAAVLDKLTTEHRAVLTLRYLDGLAVPAVAEHLGRSVHATESLLVRARSSFRREYEKEGDDDAV